ncbi:MAG: formyltetrahydrofolate deformylase [Candidatus Caenarcaniphilales bacterium]|nr:formyltetrahydrofolate deformylase [Candidatus Caenarcaniphilales bacterium]
MSKFKLVIDCKDQKGIVHAVSKYVSNNNGNIIDSQQYSHGLDSHFFMRLLVDSANFLIRADKLDESFFEIAQKFDMRYKFVAEKKRMAILVSKYDHCLYDLLLRKQYGDIDVEIPVIISNHLDLKHVAESFNIPFEYHAIKYSDGASAEEKLEIKKTQEKGIIDRLKELNIDFLAMARYMQILTPQFIEAFPMKIINVHHGFLPSFKGAKPYHQAYDKGVKIIGATAHYANEDLDMGPIIEQGVIHIDHRDTVEDYISKGRDIEKQVFAQAIKAHSEDKIIVHEGKTLVFD